MQISSKIAPCFLKMKKLDIAQLERAPNSQ
jgi:hypothetical protein